MKRDRRWGERPPLVSEGEADLLAVYVADPESLPEQTVEEIREGLSRDPELARTVARLRIALASPPGSTADLTSEELRADWDQIRRQLLLRRWWTTGFRVAAAIALIGAGLAVTWLIVKGGNSQRSLEVASVDLYAERPQRRSVGVDPGEAPVAVVDRSIPRVELILNALVPPADTAYRAVVTRLGPTEQVVYEVADLPREPDGTWRLLFGTGMFGPGRYRVGLYSSEEGEDGLVEATFVFRVVDSIQ